MHRRLLILILALSAACASQLPKGPPPVQKAELPPDVEAVSLLGKQLVRPALPADVQKKREDELAQARRDYEANPNSADAIIWLGRRTAYLGRYREAIDIFTDGIAKHPKDARMYRHRGHRYITERRLAEAVKDLDYARQLTRDKPDEVEPDGQPNARNIPVSTLKTNIEYHLGLAHYLLGDYDRALAAYKRRQRLAKNPDGVVSNAYWQYLTLRRLGRPVEAEKVLEPISTSLDVIEDVSYHKLLLMYGGEIAPEELANQDPNTVEGATILYGVGAWYMFKGQPEKAFPIWQKIVDGSQWSSFGYIAAEAEIAGRGKR